ncbi:hypothetical protein OUZ56_013741 [Daphnia magna]|uniref:Uncharacterized protein n=1 Tax=Daphnia magna TaxID=35525 RepID=A0ABQ9Z6V6_9CRUS|nr:hypothetical protein OUZ56_013741 [Daphnia magna]
MWELIQNLSFPGRHPSTKPWVIDDIHSRHDCVVNWYKFYKVKSDSRLRSCVYCERDHVSQRKWLSLFATSDLPVCHSDVELLKSS